MHVNSNIIEGLAVTKIYSMSMQRGSTLQVNIPMNDKGVSFDGHIEVYNDHFMKVNSLLGRVPVQVKGKTVKIFSPLQAKYPVKVDDLKNYYREGGAIFFVCEINNSDDVKVFAHILLPLDLRVLINKAGVQKTVTIYLSHIKDCKTLTYVCSKFLEEKSRQPVRYIEKHSFKLEDFEKIKVSRVSFAPSEKPFNLLNQDMYLYGLKEEVEYPISIVNFEKIRHEGITYIDIDGEFIPHNYEFSEAGDSSQILFEQTLLLTFKQKRSLVVNFKILKIYSLESYFKILKLLKKFGDDGAVDLFNGSLQVSLTKGELSVVVEEFDWLTRTMDLYDKIGIPHSYVCKDPEDSLMDYLDTLHEVFITGEYDKVKLPLNPMPGILAINLGKDLIFTCFFPDEEEKIQSIGGETFSQKQITIALEETSEHFKVSPYLLVEPKYLFTAANITFEVVRDSFKVVNHIYNECTFNTTNNFCIECLNFYDDSSIEGYLKLVESIYSEMLQTALSEDIQSIVTVNHLQTLERMNGKLSDTQIGQLIEIKENPKFSDELFLRTCCNILLKNKYESEFMFNKMDKEQKKRIYELSNILFI